MSNERGSVDANQTEQASDQSRGAASRTPQPVTYAYILDRDGQWWRICGNHQQFQAPRGVDTPIAANQGDALRGERNGEIHFCCHLQRGGAGGGETDPGGGDGSTEQNVSLS